MSSDEKMTASPLNMHQQKSLEKLCQARTVNPPYSTFESPALRLNKDRHTNFLTVLDVTLHLSVKKKPAKMLFAGSRLVGRLVWLETGVKTQTVGSRRRQRNVSGIGVLNHRLVFDIFHVARDRELSVARLPSRKDVEQVVAGLY